MERLTVPAKKLDDGRTVMPIIDGRAVREHAMDLYWRLKEYEDLEEQGLLLRLPCQVGDKVYKIYDKVYEFELTGVYLYEDRAVMIIKCIELRIEVSMDINEFGKVCFLTKAEAEKKLAEMEK